ncbi:bifunctional DNA primase/polymerase [Rhodococcus sp. NPDC057297]|uniref:bifunctional DNA primase/polymerase n=1 Tax=Rhodococcus sp. NPDC057297 TaxID=3346090 RepID=UPI00362721AA
MNAAIDLRERGWHPVPIGGDTGKQPLLGGVTGRNGIDIENVDELRHAVRRWARSGLGLNIASRAPRGVIGIDADFYGGKSGRHTLIDAEQRWGVLPPTWVTTARTDGSGIRWYRLPEQVVEQGWESRGVLGAGVEIVQRHHRVGAMPPSVHHTGRRYVILGPDGKRCDALPRPELLPTLPPAWVDGLRRDATYGHALGSRAQAKAVVEQLRDGELTGETSLLFNRCLAAFRQDGGRYDALNKFVILLIRQGACGAPGVPTALRILREEYVRAVSEARGGPAGAHREFDVAEADAAQIVAGDGTAGVEAWAALQPGGLWHPSTPFPGRDRAHLRELGLLNDAGEVTDLEPPRSSWEPVDVAAALSGGGPPPPVVLRRDDGAHLFYAGKVHSVHGESESGKSWLVQCAAAQVLQADGSVLYVDFEDDVDGVVGRLLLLGVAKEVLTDVDRFVYVRPEESFGAVAARDAFQQTLCRAFALAVVDGVTDSMGTFGYSVTNNDDVAAWQREVPRQIARRTGAAVACVDHVSRDTEGRGRFALGGQHKLAGLDGAAFVVEMEKPFAVGMAGFASVRVGKDRPGHVRGLGGSWRKNDRTQRVADFHLDSTDPTSPIWTLSPPVNAGRTVDVVESDGSGARDGSAFRPTWFMERVSRYWETTEDRAQRSTTKTVDAMMAERKAANKEPKRALWRKAIDLLVDESYARREEGPRKTHEHSVVTAYRQTADPQSDSYLGADTADYVHGDRKSGTKFRLRTTVVPSSVDAVGDDEAVEAVEVVMKP